MKSAIIGIAGLLVGGLLYIVSRARSLLMFKWFEVLGAGQEVRVVRALVGPYIKSWPRWIYFSLPQALWCFGGILLFRAIWGTGAAGAWPRRLWILLFSGFALGLEVGQGLHWLPGRFDFTDLSLLVIAMCAAYVVIHIENMLGDYRQILGESKC